MGDPSSCTRSFYPMTTRRVNSEVSSTLNSTSKLILSRTLGAHVQTSIGTKGGERLAPLKVSIEQDLNSAPRLIGIERATGKTLLSIDLNPQFNSLRFGDVSVIAWKVHGIDVTSGPLPTQQLRQASALSTGDSDARVSRRALFYGWKRGME